MKINLSKKKILSVGFPGFPKGFAQVQRQTLLAKCLILEGFEVIVLCRYGIHDEVDNIPPEGVFEGIEYKYCSGTSKRPHGYLKRNLLKLKGLFSEAAFIYRTSKTGLLSGILISTNFFHNVLFYWFIAKILNIKTIIDNVEYWTSFPGLKGIIKIEKFLYDRYYFRFTDKIICISDFLAEKVPESRRKRLIKIPAITDFEKFERVKSKEISCNLIGQKYFLYCGADVYYEVIDFVVTAFEMADLPDISLVLVTKPTEILNNRLLRSPKKGDIKVLYDIPYSRLINLYTESEALIIPIRDTIQDKARFPHKISEYCASRRPIITNLNGEIPKYFNSQNSYVCSSYDLIEYSAAMHDVISDHVAAEEKSQNSFETGIKYFNYKSYSKLLADLICL